MTKEKIKELKKRIKDIENKADTSRRIIKVILMALPEETLDKIKALYRKKHWQDLVIEKLVEI